MSHFWIPCCLFLPVTPIGKLRGRDDLMSYERNYEKKSEIVIGWIIDRHACDRSFHDGRGKVICRQGAGKETHLCQWQSPLVFYCPFHKKSRVEQIASEKGWCRQRLISF